MVSNSSTSSSAAEDTAGRLHSAVAEESSDVVAID